MKYINRFLMLIIVFCMLFSANTYAANAVAGDVFVTCNQNGTETGKGTPFTSATITVPSESIDNSGKYIYQGVMIGIFKIEGTTGTLVSGLEQSIFTISTTINVTSFGDITKYEYDTTYALGYKILYQPAGTLDPPYATEWVQVNDSFFKVRNPVAAAATISVAAISIVNTNDVKIDGAGTNVAGAKYRIYYTKSDTLPARDNTDNAASPGPDWTDSGIVTDMTVSSSTSVTATVQGSSFGADWKYVLFKVAVTSDPTEQTGWVWKYTDAYCIATKQVVVPPVNDTTNTDTTNTTNSNTTNTNNPLCSGYLNYIGHNQVIKIYQSEKEIVVTGPDMPDTQYGQYTLQDLLDLKGNNKFIDQSYLKYRLEFDILKPDKASQIADMNIILNLNALDSENVSLQLISARLVSRNSDGTVAPLKDLTTVRLGGNRYSMALGDDDYGNPIIQANGAGKYAIEYTVFANIGTAPDGDTISEMRNEAQIFIDLNGVEYQVIETPRASQKYYIDTKLWRKTVGYY